MNLNMKLKGLYPVIILLLFCFIIVPLFLYLLDKGYEGFKSDYSDYTTIDRISTPDNKYAYCIAGNVTCPSGNIVKIGDSYTGGTTYNYICDDISKTPVECKNNFQYNLSGSQLYWETPDAREIAFPFSDEYKGFTVPYSYIPVKINGNYIDFYDISKNVIDNINKCKMLKTESDTDKCLSYLNKSTSSGTSTSTDDISCIADFDTQLNDPLCCGQPGTLKSTNFVCPSNKPTCGNFLCGSKYGTCS